MGLEALTTWAADRSVCSDEIRESVRKAIRGKMVPGYGCIGRPEEIVARAQSRLGEQRYRLTNNNCEHFAYWCMTGVDGSSSEVAGALAAALAASAIITAGVLMRLRSAPLPPVP